MSQPNVNGHDVHRDGLWLGLVAEFQNTLVDLQQLNFHRHHLLGLARLRLVGRAHLQPIQSERERKRIERHLTHNDGVFEMVRYSGDPVDFNDVWEQEKSDERVETNQSQKNTGRHAGANNPTYA
ncbi:MAG: hypothetical protein EWM72_02221 [Nitrospira sp.]|nr:MAG: hypothetical protein EWM72_02221 [Nitrospira sp.]